jgi:hypothetical protein
MNCRILSGMQGVQPNEIRPILVGLWNVGEQISDRSNTATAEQ